MVVYVIAQCIVSGAVYVQRVKFDHQHGTAMLFHSIGCSGFVMLS